ncbi:hypothetical protein LOC67_06840 [Stieleria sp. JC731]|uniref:hypothetical protein n=1 Tax=Pirellulaceae TaxID=2691357 RepID=UPI001E4A67CF|nr:hypothetical protein [Stieleria sp. JC731]MCC9600272.1 hypothetical protein [Stieleria sp. JC731]
MTRVSFCAVLMIGMLWHSDHCRGQENPPASELGSTMTAEELFGSARPTEAKPPEPPKKSALEVSPASEPNPALRYQLWPSRIELKPGSANLYAARAMVSLQHVEFAWSREAEQNGSEHPFQLDFQEGPKLETIQPYSDAVEQICTELGHLAYCEDQTRDLRIRDERGSAIYMTLLPEIQASRSLAKALRFRIRTLALQRKYDEAIEQLRIGFRLSEYVGDGETVIERLVGNAIASIMCDEIEFMIQQPDCPNLYWALASLPKDLGDPAEQAILELNLMQRHMPILEMAEDNDFSDEVWMAQATKMVVDLKELGRSDFSMVYMLQLLADNSTPSARQSLIDRGMNADVVNQMSKIRAVLLNANYEITEQTDALQKGFLLSEPERQSVLKVSEADFAEWRNKNPQNIASILTGLLLPAVTAVNQSGVRTQLRLRRLMAVESIRNHAAIEGQLPESLQAVADLPVPNDPYTGASFDYSVDNESLSFNLSAETTDDTKSFSDLHVRLRKQ